MPDQDTTTCPPQPAGRRRKRAAPITYRPPAALRGELYARQLRSGLSMNAFITKAIFDGPVPRQSRSPSFEKGDLARLLGHATQLHDRFRDIAPDDDPNDGPDDGHDSVQSAFIKATMDDLATIRAALLDLIGRTP